MNKQIEELYNKLDAQDKIINTQALEIAKLKNQKQEAIEYLKLFDDNSTLIDHSIIKGALNILGDKEND